MNIDMDEIIKLVADSFEGERKPIFAGRCAPERTYRRDFVVNDENVLAICNALVVNECDRASKFEGFSSGWTILTKEFTPLDLSRLKMSPDRILNRQRATVYEGLASGYVYASEHPNKLVSPDKQKRVCFCNDCETLFPEPYMVNNLLWNSLVPLRQRCILCLNCLQIRARRKLVIDDFIRAPINNGIFFGYGLGTKDAEEDAVDLKYGIVPKPRADATLIYEGGMSTGSYMPTRKSFDECAGQEETTDGVNQRPVQTTPMKKEE